MLGKLFGTNLEIDSFEICRGLPRKSIGGPGSGLRTKSNIPNARVINTNVFVVRVNSNIYIDDCRIKL